MNAWVLYCQSAAATSPVPTPQATPSQLDLHRPTEYYGSSFALGALWHKGDLASIFFILQLDLI